MFKPTDNKITIDLSTQDIQASLSIEVKYIQKEWVCIETNVTTTIGDVHSCHAEINLKHVDEWYLPNSYTIIGHVKRQVTKMFEINNWRSEILNEILAKIDPYVVEIEELSGIPPL